MGLLEKATALKGRETERPFLGGLLQRALKLKIAVENGSETQRVVDKLATGGLRSRAEQFLQQELSEKKTLEQYLTNSQSEHSAQERLQPLWDALKKILSAEDLELLWSEFLQAASALTGIKTLILFSYRQGKEQPPFFEAVAHLGTRPHEELLIKAGQDSLSRYIRGSEIPEELFLKTDGIICQQLTKNMRIYQSDEFSQKSLEPLERQMIETAQLSYFVPLRDEKQLLGVLWARTGLVLPEQRQPLLLLSELTAICQKQVLLHDELLRKWESRAEALQLNNSHYQSLLSLVSRASESSGSRELYDILALYLEKELSVSSFSLVLRTPNEESFHLFAGTHITDNSKRRFKLSKHSNLIHLVSNLNALYELENFQNNKDIKHCYSDEDIIQMEHYWISPLLCFKSPVGFLAIHKTGGLWAEQERELVFCCSELMASFFASSIMHEEQESSYIDSFRPLEERLQTKFAQCLENGSPISMVEIRIKNLKQIGDSCEAIDIVDFFSRLHQAMRVFLSQDDSLIRLGKGRFILILPDREGKETATLKKKIIQRLPATIGPLKVKVKYRSQLVCAPWDASKPEEMLAILD